MIDIQQLLQSKHITMEPLLIRESDMERLEQLSNQFNKSKTEIVHFLLEFYETWRFEDFE